MKRGRGTTHKACIAAMTASGKERVVDVVAMVLVLLLVRLRLRLVWSASRSSRQLCSREQLSPALRSPKRLVLLVLQLWAARVLRCALRYLTPWWQFFLQLFCSLSSYNSSAAGRPDRQVPGCYMPPWSRCCLAV